MKVIRDVDSGAWLAWANEGAFEDFLLKDNQEIIDVPDVSMEEFNEQIDGNTKISNSGDIEVRNVGGVADIRGLVKESING